MLGESFQPPGCLWGQGQSLLGRAEKHTPESLWSGFAAPVTQRVVNKWRKNSTKWPPSRPWCSHAKYWSLLNLSPVPTPSPSASPWWPNRHCAVTRAQPSLLTSTAKHCCPRCHFLPVPVFSVSHTNTAVGLGRQEWKPCPGCSAAFWSCSSDLESSPWVLRPPRPALSYLFCCDPMVCRPFSFSSLLSQIPGLSLYVRGQRPSFHGVRKLHSFTLLCNLLIPRL